MIVLYGMTDRGKTPVELHMLVAEHFVVTVHDSAISGLERSRARHAAPRRSDKPRHLTPIVVLHQILDSMADGYFPLLSKLDDEIDASKKRSSTTPTDEQLQRLFTMKRELIAMRKVVTPMRDMLGAVFTGVVELPGFDPETLRLVARRLRPHDPDLRPGRQLQRSSHRSHGRVPVDRLEPVEQRDEAVDRDRDDLLAAHLRDRVLRPELLVPGQSHPARLDLLGLRLGSAPRARRSCAAG